MEWEPSTMEWPPSTLLLRTFSLSATAVIWLFVLWLINDYYYLYFVTGSLSWENGFNCFYMGAWFVVKNTK